MDFDQILRLLGEFGPYQKRIFFLICLLDVPVAFHMLAQVFMGPVSDHWCAVSAWADGDCAPFNLTESQCALAKRNASVPWDAGRARYDQCRRYNVSGLSFRPGLDTSNLTVEGCLDGWVYDTSQYKSTIKTDVSCHAFRFA